MVVAQISPAAKDDQLLADGEILSGEVGFHGDKSADDGPKVGRGYW